MQISTLTTSDGLKLHTRYWATTQTPKGVVVMVHGIHEHIGRYVHVAEALNDGGYHVYGMDHRGHGQSEGEQVHVDNHQRFRDDLKLFVDSIRQQHPALKLFMLGHSMGSVVSLQFTLAHQNLLTGLIVTGTAITAGDNLPQVTRTVGNFLAKIAPKFKIAPPSGPEILTSDPVMIQKFHEDNLMYKGATRVSLGKYVIDTGEMIQSELSKITLPLLIMHGEADKLTPISGSQVAHQRAGSKDKTLITYPAMNHEIMNEVGREKVLQQIIDWLNKH